MNADPAPNPVNPTDGRRRTGLRLALAAAGLSGVAVFLNAYAVKAFGDATAFTTAKNAVAAIALVAVVAAAPAGGARLTRPTSGTQWLGLGLVGLLGGAVAFVLFFEGLASASSTQAALIHKTLVLWVAALAVLVLRERLGPWHWAAIGLLLIGQAGLGGGLFSSWGRGEWLILAATLLWSVEVVVAKRLLAELSSWTVALARMVLGSVLLVAWLVATGDAGALVGLTARQWAWVLVTGVLLAGYVSTWFAALARAGAVDVTAVLVLGAVVTALLGGVVQGRPVTPQVGWLVLLCLGVGIVAARGRSGAAGAPRPVEVAAAGPARSG
jgi:drug/metabolite transporter (DMT)-like permease